MALQTTITKVLVAPNAPRWPKNGKVVTRSFNTPMPSIRSLRFVTDVWHQAPYHAGTSLGAPNAASQNTDSLTFFRACHPMFGAPRLSFFDSEMLYPCYLFDFGTNRVVGFASDPCLPAPSRLDHITAHFLTISTIICLNSNT
jgi:hypothetical protein